MRNDEKDCWTDLRKELYEGFTPKIYILPMTDLWHLAECENRGRILAQFVICLPWNQRNIEQIDFIFPIPYIRVCCSWHFNPMWNWPQKVSIWLLCQKLRFVLEDPAQFQSFNSKTLYTIVQSNQSGQTFTFPQTKKYKKISVFSFFTFTLVFTFLIVYYCFKNTLTFIRIFE